MKTLIIYDSVFGNTKKLAEAMASSPDIKTVSVTKAESVILAEFDRLLVGSPTRGFKPTPPITEWLKSLPPDALSGKQAAAFDSRISPDKVKSGVLRLMMKKFGYAAPDIEKELKKKGAAIVAPSEGFFVDESEGPLSAGEEDRATAWIQKMN